MCRRIHSRRHTECAYYIPEASLRSAQAAHTICWKLFYQIPAVLRHYPSGSSGASSNGFLNGALAGQAAVVSYQYQQRSPFLKWT